MSKKMLKRSLALGALMAFVITGSAMAAEVTELQGENQTYGSYTESGFNATTGKDIEIIGTNNETITFSLDGSQVVLRSYGNCKLGVDKVKNVIVQGSFSSTDPNAYYSGNAFCAANGGKLEFTNIGTLKTGEKINGLMVFQANGNGSEISVNADTIDVRDYNYGILAHAGGKVELNAKNITMMSEGSTTIYCDHSKVDGLRNTVSIIAEENVNIYSGKYVVCTWNGEANGSDVLIKGKNITIDADYNDDGVGYVVYGIKNSVTNIEASETANISGDILAQDTSQVNIGFNNSESVFNGLVTTDSGANTTLNFKAGTWNLKGASTVSNVTFGADSKLVIDGATFKYSDAANATNIYALTAAGTEKSLTVTNGAKLVITGGEEAKTYNIAKGFAEGAGENWTLEADNALWIADWTDVDNNVNTLQATIALKDADQLVNTGVVEDTHADFVASVMESKDDNADDVKEFLKETVGAGATPAAKAQAKEKIAQAFQAGEAAGTSATAANIVKNTTGATTQRMSFSNRPSAHKGGHGPSVSEDKNGGAIWAQYVHGKDKVNDMPMAGTTASYEGKFNGVVLGADFKQVGKYQSGVSFNYGEGDTYSTGSSAYSRNDYDFWGIGYYGAVQNADSNVIFDVNYAKSDTDVEQMNGTTTITASPETTTWSAGVRVEKLIDKGAVQYVPYTGLRYMSIDTDSYTNSLNVVTETERQDIWLLPVGVSFRQDNVYDSGWVVTPKVDLSYIWAFGDTESEMTIDVPGATDVSFSRLGYTVMDDGSFLGSIGLEASKGDWTFGVAYSYQKGDYSRSDKWYVDAKYSF